jgi:hypothetical protein
MYEDLKATFKFEYDARPEADEDEKNRWVELIDIATSNPNLIPAMNMSGWDFNIGEAFKKVVSASGTTDSEKVLTEIKSDEMMGGVAVDEMGNSVDAVEGEVMPQEDELTVTMEEYGVDQDIAQRIIQARSEGFQEEEIVKFLQGGN